MKITYDPEEHTAYVVLSRRNLESLLLKLDEPDSFRTIVRDRNGPEEPQLILHAQSNEEHYADHAPGVMHPREEARLTTEKKD